MLALAACALLAGAGVPSSCHGGETLDAVKTRRVLRCGVSEGIAGLSQKDASGRWRGLEADFCRAVAAAVLSDPEKVSFVPLKASERFPALKGGLVDLLVRDTTWTIGREARLDVLFPGVLFYDGQAFMVPAKSRVKKVSDLKGMTICVEKGTTHEDNLQDYFAVRGIPYKPLVVDSTAGVADAFFAGRCGAYTADGSKLAAERVRAPGGPKNFRMLPERISKEPLGPVVRGGDDDWFVLVRWILFSLVTAEEMGVTREAAGGLRRGAPNAMVRRLLSGGGSPGKALGVGEDAALRAVQSVGNYGELFERNLGRQSELKLERGLNRLWSQGGLLYAPPLR